MTLEVELTVVILLSVKGVINLNLCVLLSKVEPHQINVSFVLHGFDVFAEVEDLGHCLLLISKFGVFQIPSGRHHFAQPRALSQFITIASAKIEAHTFVCLHVFELDTFNCFLLC
jgi:hypothetical protein